MDALFMIAVMLFQMRVSLATSLNTFNSCCNIVISLRTREGDGYHHVAPLLRGRSARSRTLRSHLKRS
jgi:hypothetical protein